MRLILLSLFLLGWGGATYGILSVQEWNVSWAHAICGPWGCGPTAQSLLAYHGFWLSLLGGGAVLLGIEAPASALRATGYWLVGIGILLMAAIGAWDMWNWLPQTTTAHSQYLWQRYLFSVATQSDIPAIQCILVGIGLVTGSKFRRSAVH